MSPNKVELYQIEECKEVKRFYTGAIDDIFVQGGHFNQILLVSIKFDLSGFVHNIRNALMAYKVLTRVVCIEKICPVCAAGI